jgi:hypothetical protein
MISPETEVEDDAGPETPRLSDLAVAKLASSGISPEAAFAAGIYSVENAKVEVHEEFNALPALVFQYYDENGNLVFFERDGELLQYVRVRYLKEPPATGFVAPNIVRKRPKYFQLKRSGVYAYFPKVAGFNWRAIADDPTVNVVWTEGELKSLAGCLAGVATIGLGGVDCFLRKPEQGA